MKPAPFAYHAPTTVDEALDILAAHGDEARPLAGGQSLVPMLALRLARFEHLVDLNRIPALAGVTASPNGLDIGAMTRQAVVARDPEVAAVAPLLARATALVGHFQIRNRGTIGGSLAHADPASEYEAVVLALGAELEVIGAGGSRWVRPDEFFVGTFTTAIGPGELLRTVRLPRWPRRSGFAIEEFARRHGDFAVAGAAAAVALGDGGRVARAGVALFGMGPTAVRAVAAEEALATRSADELDDDALRDLAALAVDATDPPDDVHGDARYRRRVAAHLTERALREALTEARDG